MNIHHLLQWCTEQLQPSLFQDYAPNGLQVEGTNQISSIVAAVTASANTIKNRMVRARAITPATAASRMRSIRVFRNGVAKAGVWSSAC